MQTSGWVSTGGSYTHKFPKLAFPLTSGMPEVYVPQSTVLQTSENSRTHAWLWCYLERRTHGKRYLFNPSSLSARRVGDLPKVIERLSKRFRFDNSSPRTVNDELANGLSRFLNWLDGPTHKGRYEAVLCDPDLALEALKKHHSHLRQRMQGNQSGRGLSAAAASMIDTDAIKMMSVVHDREFANEIEAIKYIHGEGVRVPKSEHVAQFMACLQGVFDSVARIVLDRVSDDKAEASPGDLCWQSGGQLRSVHVEAATHTERVMEIGCLAFAALCIGDSGANLASIQSYEEPPDMDQQLNNPEKITLRQKVIKLRAGGKEVPVHLTSTTFTRMRTYLRVREELRKRLNCEEIGPLFIQCRYPASKYAKPLEITPLTGGFTSTLVSRFSALGIILPKVTMQQLRTYKGGKLAKEFNPKVTADMMGHSVSTGIRKYSKITDDESRAEMGPFLSSLTSIVLRHAEDGSAPGKRVIPITAIPAGGCEDLGNPQPLSQNPLVVPDCKKTEGCFFCSKYHIHADEQDSRKLMSCQLVLKRLSPGVGGSGSAERVYAVVVHRIAALLDEIHRISPQAHDAARIAVYEEGKLTRYWATKLQQLYLLGLLPSNTA